MGSTGGSAESQLGWRVRDSLRVELGSGSRIQRRADGGMAAVRGAEV